MKKMNSYLKLYIKKMNGNLLGIGIEDDAIVKLIDKNDKILNCDLLNSNSSGNKKRSGKKSKTISIKRIRKIFRKDKFDYIVANAEELKKYFKTFVRDSVFINKKIIYIYVNKDYDFSHLEIMYKRYNTDIEIKECSDGNILIIDVKNSTEHKVKNKLYYIWDLIYDFFDNIGEFLVKY